MQRKRGELVPVAEAFSDLSGPVAAIRDASPQALHHFTQADQVNQLVSASEADPALGFMARMMALCSLPRTNPGNRLQYKRVNGPYKLIMIAGGDNKLPFGNYPRLLLAWVSTEAVRTQSRVIVLGSSLAKFMRELGIYSSGGREGTKLRNQMRRLLATPLFLAADRWWLGLLDRAMTAHGVRRMLKRRLKEAGLPQIIVPHSFRVMVVTDLLGQNVPMEDVQYLAGHSNPQTTQIYDRRRRRVTRNIVERISV